MHRSGQGGQRRILPDHGAGKGVGDHGGGGDGPIGFGFEERVVMKVSKLK